MTPPRRRPQSSPHLHRDSEVTTRRLDLFAAATRDEQVAVLPHLRRRAADDSHTTELTVIGLALTIIATVVLPQQIDLSDLSPLSGIIAGAIIGFVAIIALVPSLVSSVVHASRRQTALVWVRAYEDELTRQHGRGGIAGRRWRRAH